MPPPALPRRPGTGAGKRESVSTWGDESLLSALAGGRKQREMNKAQRQAMLSKRGAAGTAAPAPAPSAVAPATVASSDDHVSFIPQHPPPGRLFKPYVPPLGKEFPESSTWRLLDRDLPAQQSTGEFATRRIKRSRALYLSDVFHSVLNLPISLLTLFTFTVFS